MLKNILISSCLSFILLHAGSFEFTSVKRDSSGVISDSGLKIANEKEVIATGYGTTQQQALDNAFKTAIEQYVGVIVDSETMMKNGKLIKDNILTASNGFIKSYKELSIDNSDGFIAVKINALVRSQKVFNKIKSLNITTISIDNTQGIYERISTKIKNEQAKKTTKLKAKKDAEKILRKVVDDFFSNQSLQDMLNITIRDVKIDEEAVVDNKVMINISYTLELDYKIYLQKIEEMKQVFTNLGAKHYKRVDLPYLKSDGLKVKNKAKMKKLKATDFGIVEKYGQGYKLDVWKFPENWKDIYPFNDEKGVKWKDVFQIILELKDKNNRVLLANNITPYVSNKENYLLATGCNNQYKTSIFATVNNKVVRVGGFCVNYAKIIIPMFEISNKVNFNTIPMADMDNISKIKNITIELEEI